MGALTRLSPSHSLNEIDLNIIMTFETP